MDIIIVFALLAFSITATAWLSWVAGHRVGYQKGWRNAARTYREFPRVDKSDILREKIDEHNKRIGL